MSREIYEALVAAIGRPSGTKGRSEGAYRQTAKKLADVFAELRDGTRWHCEHDHVAEEGSRVHVAGARKRRRLLYERH